MMKIILVFSFLCFANAQQLVPKNCTSYNVTTVKNFTLTKYLGKWFEIKRYENLFQQNGDCAQANYTLQNSTHVKVRNTQKNLQTGVISIIEGSAQEANSSAADGKLLVTFVNRTSNYWILSTNYDAFSVVWSCVDLAPNFSAQYLWVLSRERNLTASSESAVNETIRQYGFEASKLRVTNQNAVACSGINYPKMEIDLQENSFS